MRLRDAGEHLPACLWLASPWTDLTMSGATLATKDAVDPLIHKGYLEELADAYVPAGYESQPIRASLRCLQTCAGFRRCLSRWARPKRCSTTSVRFAGAAGAADVAVTLEIWPDMIHAWPLWNAKLEAGRQALAQAGAILFGGTLVVRLLRFDATAPPAPGGRACRVPSSATMP